MAAPAPLPQPRDRSRLRDLFGGDVVRTVALWLAMVVVFVVSYRVFGPSPAPAGGRAAPGPGALLWPILVGLVLFGGWGAYFLWLRRMVARANRALADGDDREAAEVLERMGRRTWGNSRHMVRLQAGFARLRLGEPEAAMALLGAVDRSHGRVAASFGQSTAAALALGAAYLGELALARGWAAQARSRKAPHRSALHVVAEAIAAAREGDPQGAARDLDQAWEELERTTTGAMLKPVRVVREFVRRQAGLASLEDVTTLEPARYAWLGARWPELAAFLDDAASRAAARGCVQPG